MVNLTIDINGECNIACEFCYQDLDGSMLSAEKVMGYVKANSQAEVIEIGGGEPFLHDDLIKILCAVADFGKKAHVSTNAVFIPDGLFELEEIVRNKITVQVSLHAGNPGLYHEITGKDFFDCVVENIAHLKDFYKTIVNAVVYQKNFENVPEILDIAESLSVPLRVGLVMPIGNGENVKLIDRVQLKELQSYLFSEKINGKMVDSPLLHFNNCSVLEETYGLKKEGICPFECGKKYVSPAGEVFGCEFVRGKK